MTNTVPINTPPDDRLSRARMLADAASTNAVSGGAVGLACAQAAAAEALVAVRAEERAAEFEAMLRAVPSPEPGQPLAVLSADSPVGTVAVIGEKYRHVRVVDIPGVECCWRRTTKPGDEDVAWVSFAFLEAEGARLLSPGPVPLASADLLSDEAMDQVWHEAYPWGPSGVHPTDSWKAAARRVVDAANAKLRERFPDTTAVEPEPDVAYLRSVAELTDDEVDAAIETALARSDSAAMPHLSARRAYARALYDAIAARLRVDVPARDPEPAEITAAMLDAAEVGWTVDDSTRVTWRKRGPRGWEFDGVVRSAKFLIETDGPLSNLRPPAAAAETQVIDRARIAKPFSQDDAYPTRDILTAAVLRSAAEWFDRDRGSLELLASQGAANADVDQAAREHVAALGGTAPAGFVREDHVYRGAPGRNSDVTLGGLPALPWLPIKFGLAGGRLGFATRPYEPTKLAGGSVVIANGRTWTRAADQPVGSPDNRHWMVTPVGGIVGAEHGWRTDAQVPTDGVLVVDGAQLGGGR